MAVRTFAQGGVVDVAKVNLSDTELLTSYMRLFDILDPRIHEQGQDPHRVMKVSGELSFWYETASYRLFYSFLDAGAQFLKTLACLGFLYDYKLVFHRCDFDIGDNILPVYWYPQGMAVDAKTCPASLCRSTLRPGVRSAIENLRSYLNKLKADFIDVAPLVSRLSLEEPLLYPIQLVKDTFAFNESKSSRRESSFYLAERAEGFKREFRFAGEMLHAALLHSNLQPNQPTPGISEVIYHRDFGTDAWKIVATLLNRLADRKANLRLRAVEIGVCAGYTSAYLLEFIPTLEFLLSVDPYFDGDDELARGFADGQHEQVEKLLSRYGARSSLWRLTSAAAASKFAQLPNSELDLVWIDGDHSYEGAKTDIHSWAGHLRKPGILVGHDYNARWPGVVKAVNEYAEHSARTLHLGLDFTWWIYVDD